MGNATSNGTHPSQRTGNSLYGQASDNGRKHPPRRNLNTRQSWPNSSSVDYHNSANLRSSINRMRPIIFNQVHGQNIIRSSDGLTVSREGSFCNAVVFSSRPIAVMEPFSLRLHQCTTRGWSGVLRFGYTLHCPDRLRSPNLSKYVCPDMTVKPGNWAKALKESSARNGDVLTFFFNSKGEAYLSINAGRFNLFFSGVDATKPLWGLMDVYGNTTGLTVEVDYPVVIPNERQLRAASIAVSDNAIAANLPQPPQRPLLSQTVGAGASPTPPSHPTDDLPIDRMMFHNQAHGHNIIFRDNQMVAERRQDSYNAGLVFTSEPLAVGYHFCIEIVGVCTRYIGNLGVGLTACNPDQLVDEVLPSESENLVDRPEYWVITKDLDIPVEGGQMGFVINSRGEFHCVGEDGSSKGILMHVDTSVPLWLFLDVYGATQAIRSKGVKKLAANVFHDLPLRLAPTPVSTCAAQMAQLALEEVDGSREKKSLKEPKTESASTRSSKSRSKPPRPSQPPRKRDDECKICMEKAVNTVFYKCGHSCACEACGMKLKGKHCPLCRQSVVDVIKVFRS